MHDLDRTLWELQQQGESIDEQEALGGCAGRYDRQAEDGELDEADLRQAEQLDEAEEVALATELLSLGQEDELDHFLGGIIKRAARSVGKAIQSPAGRALGGVLKRVAKQALPMVASALAPGLGAPLAAAASDAFGLESEGLSEEDREFEAARGFIRFADQAARHAAAASTQGASPQQLARQAVTEAARRYAPGLLRQPAAVAPQSGRWVRRGRTIVLLGA
jgi:hypothetical protein